ncbi:MAG: hypothetical protein ACJAVU_000339 [Cognaticolwellia sp.]|jgi:hypothetical protein|tara:strand:- start:130 stop:708 length:579 start_codon:yes stop_codon:yes gene_type:complete
MIKNLFKLITTLFLLVSNCSFAGFITTDLTEDTYITYKGYDWTWASSVNVTTYDLVDFFTEEKVKNIFEDASVHQGWMSFSAGSDLDFIFQEIVFDDFLDGNKKVIQSFAYWNSYFIDVDKEFNDGTPLLKTTMFNQRRGAKDDNDNGFENFETFYVRASVAQAPAVVPEPTTLFIFGAGLLGFALRKRKIK